MIPNVTYEILHPVHANAFRLSKFGDWKEEKVMPLVHQLISVKYTINFDANRGYDEDGYNIEMIFEDDIKMRCAGAIQHINPRIYQDIIIEQFCGWGEAGTPFRKIVFSDAMLKTVNYDLDYAASGTAKFVLNFKAKNIHVEAVES